MFQYHFLHQFFGVGVDNGAVHIFGVDQHVQIVGILYAVDCPVQVAFAVFPFRFNIGLEAFQVVFGSFHVVQSVHHIVDRRLLVHRIIAVGAVRGGRAHKGFHQGTQVGVGFLNRQGIRGQGFFLNGVDIGVEALRNREHQCNANNADTSCERSQHGSALFGKQVFQGQGE